jgi:hypothetical protein
VCARGAWWAPLGGPSTSPLGAMFSRVAFLVALSVPVGAQPPTWTPYNQGLAQQHQVNGEAKASLDHLVPFDFPNIVLADCAATYTVAPSLGTASGWCLTRIKDGYRLEAWTDRCPVADTHCDSVVVPIDKEIAELLQDIWINALLDTHYPRAYSDGLDGTMYFFQVHSQGLYLRGQTWSPEGERPPAWLVSVASDVMSYAGSEGSDHEKLRAALARCRDQLFSYYRKRGSRGA